MAHDEHFDAVSWTLLSPKCVERQEDASSFRFYEAMNASRPLSVEVIDRFISNKDLMKVHLYITNNVLESKCVGGDASRKAFLENNGYRNTMVECLQ